MIYSLQKKRTGVSIYENCSSRYRICRSFNSNIVCSKHDVTAVGIVSEYVNIINNQTSAIEDEYISKYFAEKEPNLTATDVKKFIAEICLTVMNINIHHIT